MERSCREKIRTTAPEGGAIVVLFAMLALVLLGTLGLSIDVGLALAGAAKQQRVAELSALAAMEGYANSPQNDPFSTKVQNALARARAVSGLGGNLLVVNSFLQIPLEPNRVSDIGLDITGAEGRLTAGRWWPIRADAQCYAGSLPLDHCACKQQSDFRPCFSEIPPNAPSDASANAFQVEVQLPPQSLFVTQFARLLGLQMMQIRSEGIAAYTPRRGVFIMDLTGSMTVETHLDAGPLASEFAFRMHDGFSADCLNYEFDDPASTPPCVDYPNGVYPDDLTNPDPNTWCPFPDEEMTETGIMGKWRRMAPHRNGVVGDVTQHFRDDYRCFRVNFKSFNPISGAMVDVEEKYLIDFYGSTNYLGPEPFTRTLRSVHRAMEQFHERAVSGDRFSIMGFDEHFLYGLDEKPIRESELLVPDKLQNAPGKFGYWFDIADVDNPVSAMDRFKRRLKNHIFFTRYGVRSNISVALQQALTLLQQPNPDGISTQDFVVYFGDGISNCLGSTFQCANDYVHHKLSLDEIVGGIADDFQAAEVSMHVDLIGNAVQPHHIVRTSMRDQNACMSMEEFAFFTTIGHPGIPAPSAGGFVDSTFPEGFSEASCFPGEGYVGAMCPPGPILWPLPNRLHEAVAKTGGYWFPIQTACSTNSVGICEVSALLNQKCAERIGQLGTLWREKSTNVSNLMHPNDSSVLLVDSKGRLLCNENCLSPEEQISAAIDKIMGESPFVLVSPG